MELQEQLKEEAICLGLCDQWQNNWGEPDFDALCKKFLDGIDFCIKHDWPSVEFIKDNFDKKELAEQGIFASGKHTCTGKLRVVTMGSSVVTIDAQPYEIVRVYARHNSTVVLNMHPSSHVYISTYDNCKVSILSKAVSSRVCVSHFGGKLKNKSMFDTINKKKGE